MDKVKALGTQGYKNFWAMPKSAAPETTVAVSTAPEAAVPDALKSTWLRTSKKISALKNAGIAKAKEAADKAVELKDAVVKRAGEVCDKAKEAIHGVVGGENTVRVPTPTPAPVQSATTLLPAVTTLVAPTANITGITTAMSGSPATQALVDHAIATAKPAASAASGQTAAAPASAAKGKQAKPAKAEPATETKPKRRKELGEAHSRADHGSEDGPKPKGDHKHGGDHHHGSKQKANDGTGHSSGMSQWEKNFHAGVISPGGW